MEQVVLEGIPGFSFKFFFGCHFFLLSFISKKFGFFMFENQALKVSIVYFSSTENSSDRDVLSSRANTAEEESFS